MRSQITGGPTKVSRPVTVTFRQAGDGVSCCQTWPLLFAASVNAIYLKGKVDVPNSDCIEVSISSRHCRSLNKKFTVDLKNQRKLTVKNILSVSGIFRIQLE